MLDANASDSSHSVTFEKIKTQMMNTTGQLFDVIHMDPPWQLATANPTRGVALGYSQLSDTDIKNLPIPTLQKNGKKFFFFIFLILFKNSFFHNHRLASIHVCGSIENLTLFYFILFFFSEKKRFFIYVDY